MLRERGQAGSVLREKEGRITVCKSLLFRREKKKGEEERSRTLAVRAQEGRLSAKPEGGVNVAAFGKKRALAPSVSRRPVVSRPACEKEGNGKPLSRKSARPERKKEKKAAKRLRTSRGEKSYRSGREDVLRRKRGRPTTRATGKKDGGEKKKSLAGTVADLIKRIRS